MNAPTDARYAATSQAAIRTNQAARGAHDASAEWPDRRGVQSMIGNHGGTVVALNGGSSLIGS
jgi:hypothetical protein